MEGVDWSMWDVLVGYLVGIAIGYWIRGRKPNVSRDNR